jgi:phenylpyruvate tautomerase PptA (4-oxalocrotonate tautomerase family)
MPLVRIDTTQRLDAQRRRAMGNAVHRALVETINVPPDDRFQVIVGHADAELNVTPGYLGIEHAPDVVLVQITISIGRTVEQKKALFERIADGVAEAGAVRPEDVIVNLVEVVKENWSFGNGEAQYAK